MYHPLTLLVLLVASTAAQLDYCTGDKSTTGYCETLSYIDRTTTSLDPPSSSDCQDACRGVLSDAGDWGVDFRGTHHLIPSSPPADRAAGQPASYRQNMVGYPCGFSIGPAPGQPKDYSFSMHNQDIVDVLDEVTRRFAPLHAGKVAAEGRIKCEGFEAVWYVT
jgi:hypothetical protein